MAEDPRDVVRRMLDEVNSRLERCHQLIRPFEAVCNSIVTRLKELPCSKPFVAPVSKAAYPLYYERVKKPLALNDVIRKLKQHQYETLMEFAEDLRLIVRNCHSFNQFDGELCAQAREMEIQFETMLVQDAGLPRQDTKRFQALFQSLPPEKKSELARLVSAYEGLQSGRITIQPAKMKIATQRVFARFLDENVSAEVKARVGTERPVTPAGLPATPTTAVSGGMMPRSTLGSSPLPDQMMGGGGPTRTLGGRAMPPLSSVASKDDHALLKEVQRTSALFQPQVAAVEERIASPVPGNIDPPLAAMSNGALAPEMKQNSHTLAQFYHAPSPVREGSSDGGDRSSQFSTSSSGSSSGDEEGAGNGGAGGGGNAGGPDSTAGGPPGGRNDAGGGGDADVDDMDDIFHGFS